jgi:phage tail sheath protein FI
MGFLVSPGVEVNEIDLTNVIPAVSTSIGGYAGQFNWGPVGDLINISSENDLAANFGKPDTEHSESFLTAASFLKYGNSLKVSRAVGDDALNAVAGPEGGPSSPTNLVGEQFENLEAFESASTFHAEELAFARCPGTYGNGLKVVLIATGATATDARPWAGEFDFAPGTTDFGTDNSISNDEIHILVLDGEGTFTGIRNSILEKFQGLSVIKGAKLATGRNNYFADVVNNGSQYVFLTDNFASYHITNAAKTVTDLGSDTLSLAQTIDSPTAPFVGDDSTKTALLSFAKGTDTGTIEIGDIENALDLFSDAETVDVNLLFADTGGTQTIQTGVEGHIIEIANARKDLLGCGSAPIDLDTKASDQNKVDAITKADGSGHADGLARSNYFASTGSTAYVYNKYTDKYQYIGTQGYLAGLCANTDDVAEPWFSPAGFNRGQLLGVTRLSFNPKQNHRDTLYKAAVNPITNFPGQGITLFGDKTFTMKPSAFDRINVRRLFMVLEKAIATAAKFQLFELNDEFTRAMFRNMTEPFLRDVKGRRGITDFLVVCDETNNTGQVIDTNRFVADIYIKPARSINFITLNFIATRTGVEFSEIVGTN